MDQLLSGKTIWCVYRSHGCFRLLSWAGKRIEPYGVDYILNKLGFSQAKTTIPKWVQRGAMDPLDKILSLVLSRTIAAQRVKESSSSSSASQLAAQQHQSNSAPPTSSKRC